MDLQQRGLPSLLLIVATLASTLAVAGCIVEPSARVSYALVGTGSPGTGVRLFRSPHHLLYTTLTDDSRIDSIVATLEAAYRSCVEVTRVKPADDAVPMNVFLFAHRDEWEAFTRARAGAMAPVYLRLDRGGYTLGKACALRDQGERDTLTILSHEQMHLFIATYFQARPPPFLEEGLATLLEDVHVDDGVGHIAVGRSASRAARLEAVCDAKALVPLRRLLSMHAGNVVGLSGVEVEAFYAQAWAFAHFLNEGESGRYRSTLARLLQDASSGALSSASLADDPALVERYVGEPLETIDAAYRTFAQHLR